MDNTKLSFFKDDRMSETLCSFKEEKFKKYAKKLSKIESSVMKDLEEAIKFVKGKRVEDNLYDFIVKSTSQEIPIEPNNLDKAGIIVFEEYSLLEDDPLEFQCHKELFEFSSYLLLGTDDVFERKDYWKCVLACIPMNEEVKSYIINLANAIKEDNEKKLCAKKNKKGIMKKKVDSSKILEEFIKYLESFISKLL